jgi:hypothetical protein
MSFFLLLPFFTPTCWVIKLFLQYTATRRCCTWFYRPSRIQWRPLLQSAVASTTRALDVSRLCNMPDLHCFGSRTVCVIPLNEWMNNDLMGLVQTSETIIEWRGSALSVRVLAPLGTTWHCQRNSYPTCDTFHVYCFVASPTSYWNTRPGVDPYSHTLCKSKKQSFSPEANRRPASQDVSRILC